MFDGHDEPRLYAITEHLGRLKHDLGKYICFRQRWLDADADHDAWIGALRADLLATRSGPSGSMRVDQVWEEFRPWLEGAGLDVRSDPDGAELFAAMARALGALPGLERGEVDVDAVHAACLEVSERVRSLHARGRDALRQARTSPQG